MILWPHLYFITLLGGAGLTLIATPLFQRLAEKLDFMDRPKGEKHKGHGKPVALLGGAAMFSAWLCCFLFAFLALDSGLATQISQAIAAHTAGLAHVSVKLLFIILGAALAMLLGLADDRCHLQAAPKFAGQFLVALIAVQFAGIRISIFLDVPVLTWLATVFWFMLMMNSINFFDNMDGLAVGTVTIAMLFFAIVAGIQQQYFVATLASLSCGVGLGFWFFNHSPATIFMGDSGSHFLGYLIAVVSASVTYYSPEFSLSRFPVLLPLFILSIPLFDTLSVIVIRSLRRQPFWIGDHNHLSHRFVRLGMSRKRAVLLLHTLMFVINLSVLPLLWGTFQTAVVILVQLLFLLSFLTLLLNAGKTLPAASGPPTDQPAKKP
ncbi:MraY family glycosyltransferase [Victivallis sp. Marseille-Q1083]|uniref:MraY family glycosyltransferase n=1 Tax=Victivallis sp. Marseille-Q1083 TaxID=2717288 RepID=UPI0015898355|nr:MraY family glycosyltransferase [Victivallis sp. Marseille-Q1083]